MHSVCQQVNTPPKKSAHFHLPKPLQNHSPTLERSDGRRARNRKCYSNGGPSTWKHQGHKFPTSLQLQEDIHWENMCLSSEHGQETYKLVLDDILTYDV